MAAPVYANDLVLITNAETGTWGEITGFTQGGTPAIETDYYIQGTACYSQSTAGKTGLTVSMYFDFGSDLATALINKYVFFWQICTAGNAMDTFANGGMRLGIGSTIGDFKMWRSGGNDFGRNPYGGWMNIAIDPSFAADYTIGAPGTIKRYFGSMPNLLASIGKGNPLALDAIRYGRGEYQILYGDLANGYATFTGVAAQNDSSQNRYGLFQGEGTGYLWKGLLSFGKNASTCDFRDSNKNITIDNTPRTATQFNRIEINAANSSVYWDNINFTALSPAQLSRGSFEMIANAGVVFANCSFTDMSTFIFQSKADLTNVTFRRCNLVVQGGAQFTKPIFTDSSGGVSLLVSDLSKVTGGSFKSNGLNHAMQLTANASGGTYSLSDFDFINYATVNGTTGNEALYNNSGGLVTLSVLSGDQPSVRNGTNASTNFVSSVTLSLTVKGETGIPIQGVFAFIDDPSVQSPYIMNTSTNGLGVASVVWTGGVVTNATWRARKYGYKPFVATSDIPASGSKDIPVTLIVDPQQT